MRKPFRGCSEVSDALDSAPRKECCTKLTEVEPLIRGVTNRTIVEVEAIYIDNGGQCVEPLRNATTAFRRSRAQSPQRLGGSSLIYSNYDSCQVASFWYAPYAERTSKSCICQIRTLSILSCRFTTASKCRLALHRNQGQITMERVAYS